MTFAKTKRFRNLAVLFIFFFFWRVSPVIDKCKDCLEAFLKYQVKSVALYSLKNLLSKQFYPTYIALYRKNPSFPLKFEPNSLNVKDIFLKVRTDS